MSYVALATDRYDEMVEFYGTALGFPALDSWDRPNGRGQRFDLGGMRLELLDNAREKAQLPLGDPADRFHVVVEVEDLDAARSGLEVDAPLPQSTSWGARLFVLRDPDGISVTFLQWTRGKSPAERTIRGRVATGEARGQHFTQLKWAREQFVDKLGIDPFPGTVNVMIDHPESLSVWNQLKESRGVSIDNPGDGPGDCNGRCYPVLIEGRIEAAIVLPLVPGYPSDQIEIISATGIRDALGLEDGDALALEIKKEPGNES